MTLVRKFPVRTGKVAPEDNRGFCQRFWRNHPRTPVSRLLSHREARHPLVGYAKADSLIAIATLLKPSQRSRLCLEPLRDDLRIYRRSDGSEVTRDRPFKNWPFKDGQNALCHPELTSMTLSLMMRPPHLLAQIKRTRHPTGLTRPQVLSRLTTSPVGDSPQRGLPNSKRIELAVQFFGNPAKVMRWEGYHGRVLAGGFALFMVLEH